MFIDNDSILKCFPFGLIHLNCIKGAFWTTYYHFKTEQRINNTFYVCITMIGYNLKKQLQIMRFINFFWEKIHVKNNLVLD